MASDRTASRPRRRTYSDALRAQVVAECEEPGASVAKVAMSHGINANIVHRWRQWARDGRPTASSQRSEFVPVALTPTAALATADTLRDIRVEIRRGVTAVTVSWPLSAAAECAGWLRDWLK